MNPRYMKPWLILNNLWQRWRKALNDCTDNYTQEMNELQRKAYEQYRVLPDDMKKEFMK